MRKLRHIAVAALAATGLTLAVMPAQASTRKVVKSVQIGDYYFSPAKMTVRKGTYVVWKWPSGGGDGHDVQLKKGPSGVKRFHSDVFFADAKYRQQLKVPGRYSIICSLHPGTMKQTIVVKR